MAEVMPSQFTNYKYFIEMGKHLADDLAEGRRHATLPYADRIELVKAYAMLAEACKVNGS